ncbi:putative bifunctional diguanylate cyclase/phosphodiesterase [Nocardioides sp. AX2bis]|uniref:putative bifunctional diguanylate cyclase/phosphodiesterase n=1 Tax=Nocardioides sp. AX2bis TaxID=2653157 RepID=UPI0012F0617A|nr:EAL domain-containing protein [Nocardioides sp. AX2bis]VXB97921.1 putative Diguanylate cyclase [Nocardioides sp. AX2bis]
MRLPRPARGTRVARVLRLAAILAVLTAELVFVVRVYHLDDPVEDRRVALARVQALLPEAPRDGLDETAAARLGAAADGLVASGAPGADEVVDAVPAAVAGAPGAAAALREALDVTGQGVEDQRAAADRAVLALLLGLFVVVCVGWFTWFRRLARRHRAVQQALTAIEVTARGERRLEALVRNSTDVVAVLDADSTATYVSPSTLQVLGLEPEEVRGRRFVDLVDAEDRPLLARALARQEDHDLLTLRAVHAGGRPLVLEATVKDLHQEPSVGGWVLTVRDVTDRRRLEESLTHQAFHDALTGLANRQLFTDRLDHALQRRESVGGELSVLFLDIDDFKVVNDSLGHQAGDELLVAAAQRMGAAFRPQDTVARLGGDEFAVLLDDTDLDAAGDAARLVLETLDGTFVVGGRRHRLQASVGLAGTATGARTSRELMRNADVAMYHAKSQGKGCLALYDESLHARAMELLALRGELAEAIPGGQLLLHFQPTVALESQSVTGFEALVRWQHPERGLLMPDDFIPVAEQSGLVVPLGAWVLAEACRAGAALDREGGPLFMAVNVAAQQLTHPAFHDTVVDALAASGLPAERLVLEVTETVILDDVERGVATLAALRGLGVRVAIDDFGTGYNSLSNLAVLPVDVLKVDRSFVQRLGGSEDASSLVEAILAMSDALRLETVAEGVELAQQATWLREHRAVMAQGFLWSRPVALEEARSILVAGVPRTGGADPAGSAAGQETTVEAVVAAVEISRLDTGSSAPTSLPG